MTIKTKLMANILVTTAIIVGISLAGFSSMRFLQEKLSYIAEKSTPFQMGTMEFQRELQSCITDLVKVNAARNMTEYAKFRGEAESSLGSAKKFQQNLEKMNSGSQSDVSEELQQISGELFAATEERINSDKAASEAKTEVSQRMKESSTRFKGLEDHIRNLQVTRAASFAKALENTDQLSARLRGLEELRNQIKDLLAASDSAHNARINTSFLVAKGKVKTAQGRIARNKYGKFISSDFKKLTDDIDEFLKLQAIAQKDDDSKKRESVLFTGLTEKLNWLNLTLNQEIELSAFHLESETGRERDIFGQSNSANAILLANSELVAQGLMVTGEINQLFNLESAATLDEHDAVIRRLFIKISERVQTVESSLVKLNAGEEIKMLRMAAASMAAMRSELYSADGILTTLKKKLKAIEQANRSADKLHSIVLKQSAMGKESVSTALSEQERSIVEVNDMIRRSLSQIVAIGSVAIAIGIFFGFWIYRSVLLPLRVVLDAVRSQQEQGQGKASIAESIANGDLTREVITSNAIMLDPTKINKDEMGMVLNAIVGMNETQVTLDRAFAGMTASLRISRAEEIRRDRLKSGLFELNKILREEHKTAELADDALAFMAGFLGAGVGIMYLYDEKGEMLQTLSTYAISGSKGQSWCFGLGEGLPGQVALERKKICLNSVPPDYLPITSAMGEAAPLNVVIMPIQHNDMLAGVLELGSFREFTADDHDFLNQSLEGVAIAININRSRQLVNDLLEQTQQQADELSAQQEELQQSNEELEERARMLAEQRNFNIY